MTKRMVIEARVVPAGLVGWRSRVEWTRPDLTGELGDEDLYTHWQLGPWRLTKAAAGADVARLVHVLTSGLEPR